MTLRYPTLTVLLMSAFAVAGPAAAGEFQVAADSFLKCSVGKNKLTEALFHSIAGGASRQAALKARYGAEIASGPAFEFVSEFKTATIRPAGPVQFAGLPVSSLAATTCKGGDCGMAVYALNFDGLSAAERRQLKAAVARAPRSTPRLAFVDQGAKGTSVVCDIGD